MQWLQIKPVSVYQAKQTLSVGYVDKVHGYLEIPSFTLNDSDLFVWQGCSRLVACFHYTLVNKCSIVLQKLISGIKRGFIFVVKFRIGTTVYRYKLSTDNGEVLYCPVYCNQTLPKNFIIEVWTTSYTNSSRCIINSGDYRLQLSLLKMPNPIFSAADVLEAGSTSYSESLFYLLPQAFTVSQDIGIYGIDNAISINELLSSGSWQASSTDLISK